MNGQDSLRQMVDRLPVGNDPQSVRRRIETLERLLENSVTLPLLNRRIGLDALLGLVPVAGDAIAAIMGLYMVWEARNLGMSRWQITRMLGNVGFDAVLGAVPLAGDLMDFLYRSNSRNLRIVKRHLDRHHPATQVIEG